MGLLKFAMRGNYRNYYDQLKELSKKNHKSPFLMFIDTGLSVLICNSGLQDYLNYKFYEKSWKERKEYATIGYQHEFYTIAAHWDYAPFFSNKVNFHKNFRPQIRNRTRGLFPILRRSSSSHYTSRLVVTI